MASKLFLASLFLTLLIGGYAADALESGIAGRDLLAKSKSKSSDPKKLTAEQKRERDALAAYQKQQAKREKEKNAVIASARKEAEGEIQKFNKASNEEEQIQVFVNLWKNAKGPTILVVLTTLVSSSKSSSDYYIGVVAKSMLEAVRRGFSFQLADGLWQAFVLVENENDAEPLLDAVLVNLRTREKAKKGSGCVYISNLFTDAETLAIEAGYEIEFTRAFANDKYLPLAECFYKACDKAALACCKDGDAVISGRCDCLKKEPDTCDYNLFLNLPRPIWRCNGEGCKVSKCLCPIVKVTKSKSSKKESTKKSSSKETTKSAPSKETTKPAPGKETTKPAPSKKTTKPAPSKETTKLAPSKKTTKPAPSKKTTKPAPSKKDTKKSGGSKSKKSKSRKT